jgi:hypothetical protein
MSVPFEFGSTAWEPPGLGQIAKWALPYKGFGDRLLIRGLTMFACGRVRAISGSRAPKTGRRFPLNPIAAACGARDL